MAFKTCSLICLEKLNAFSEYTPRCFVKGSLAIGIPLKLSTPRCFVKGSLAIGIPLKLSTPRCFVKGSLAIGIPLKLSSGWSGLCFFTSKDYLDRLLSQPRVKNHFHW